MVMGGYAQMCYRTFGGLGDSRAKKMPELGETLQKAHIEMLPGVYVSIIYMNLLLVAIIGFIFALLFLGIIMVGTSASNQVLIILFFFIILPFITYILHLRYPKSKANGRGKQIDKQLPYASSFVAAMAAANATPEKIFKSLADQESIYGSVSEDAAWVYRDMTVLGTDTVTAIKRAVTRASSDKMAEFFQGVISTITAGGNLKLYFLNRAEYFMVENRREQRETIETLAMMAESYVVVAVAFPMFLIVMMITMIQTGGSSLGMLRLIIFAMLPVIHFSYGTLIYFMIPEV